jgi:PAS domain S-box-containing protein
MLWIFVCPYRALRNLWRVILAPQVLIWVLCLSGMVAIAMGFWFLKQPIDQNGIVKSAAMASLVDSGQSLCEDLARTVGPAIERTQILARDPEIILAMQSGDSKRLTSQCNVALSRSTEIDAIAMFDADGKITAINTIYASGKPIEQWRVDRILHMSFGGRSIIKSCARNGASSHALEFQTTCDVTPAFFDSTGLSVAYSVPVLDPYTGQKIGVVSSRMRFERLTNLIKDRAIGGVKGSTLLVTDKGGYFSEEINSGRKVPPIPTNVLAGIVSPLVQGNSSYCFTQQGKVFICLFRLKEFTTLAGGGIQVMVVADENWLVKEVRQAQFLNCGVLICLGLFLFLCALVVRSTVSLQQSEKWNRLLIDAALDAVIAVDNAGRVRNWNPQAAAIFGYSTKEAFNRPVNELIPLASSNAANLAHPVTPKDLLTGEGQVNGKRIEICSARRDRSALTLELVVTPLQVGNHVWTCIFARDVTEQRLTELHLAQSQKLESIGQMAAGIAHEINTPTQYVGDNTRFVRDSFVGLLSVLDRQYRLLSTTADAKCWRERFAEVEALRAEMDVDFLTEEIPKAMDQSIEGLESIARIVRAMKEFSHPGGNAKEAANLNAAIESTTIVCRNRWKPVADLELDLDPTLPHAAVLLGEFNQVVLNLIVNAADAISETAGANAAGAESGRKGHIRISTRAIGSQVEIRIQDNGPGIPPAVAKRIFEPFFTTKPVGKGTGQGLMLSRNVIVKKHGGELQFEPAPGGGTVFIVRLPISEPQVQQKEAA